MSRRSGMNGSSKLQPAGRRVGLPKGARPLPGGEGDESLPHVDPVLFEVGWEVCWQLGGIYTVLKTKAAAMIRRWGERYFLVGPYNPATAAGEFEELPPPATLEHVFDALRDQGTQCHFGCWLVPAGRT